MTYWFVTCTPELPGKLLKVDLQANYRKLLGNCQIVEGEEGKGWTLVLKSFTGNCNMQWRLRLSG